MQIRLFLLFMSRMISMMCCMKLCQRCVAWKYINDALHDIMSTMSCMELRQWCVAWYYVNDVLLENTSTMCFIHGIIYVLDVVPLLELKRKDVSLELMNETKKNMGWTTQICFFFLLSSQIQWLFLISIQNLPFKWPDCLLWYLGLEFLLALPDKQNWSL